MASAKTFHWVDYLIFILTLVVSAGIGIFYAWKDKRKQNTTDFLLGGRKMPILPVTLSLMASFLSAVLVLGVPTEVYYNGTMYWLISFSNILTFPVAVHAFLPVFHNLQLSSAYEYLELRFNKVIRIMGVIVFQMQMILYMAVVLYAPALALNQVMGFSLILSILVIGLVCTFYTAIGGLKAVMWTDAFQMVIVFVGLVALVIKATMEVGGFEYAWDTAKEAGKLQADNFDTNPFERHTFWTLVIGGFVTSMTIYGGNQAMIQRYLSMENVRSAQAALYWNLPASIVFTTLLVYTGLVLFAKYGNADPVGCGNIERRDQMIPWLVMDVLGDYHGFPGLVVACLFSASLSTVSSGVNALALVFLTDVLKPLYREVTTHDLNEARATIYSKILALVYGFLTIGLGFLAEKMGSLILQIALSIFGMVGGPLLSLFVMAMFFPCINSWGAGIGLIASITFSFWLAIGSIVNRRPLPLPECKENDTFAAITSIAVYSNYTTGFYTSQLDNITSTLPSFSTVAINASHLTNTSILDDVTTAFSSVLDTTTLAIQNEAAESSGLDQFYKLSYLWYSSTAVIVGVTVALFVSCATGGTRKKPVDSKLLSPLYLYLKSFAKTKKAVAEDDIELNSNQNTRNGDCQVVSPLNVTVKVSSREHAFKEE